MTLLPPAATQTYREGLREAHVQWESQTSFFVKSQPLVLDLYPWANLVSLPYDTQVSCLQLIICIHPILLQTWISDSSLSNFFPLEVHVFINVLKICSHSDFWTIKIVQDVEPITICLQWLGITFILFSIISMSLKIEGHIYSVSFLSFNPVIKLIECQNW